MNGNSLRLENSKRPHHLNDERTTHRSWRRGSTIAPDYHTRLRAGRRYRFWIRDRDAWHCAGRLERPSGAQGGRDSSWLDATALDRDVRTRAARASPAPNDGDEVYETPRSDRNGGSRLREAAAPAPSMPPVMPGWCRARLSRASATPTAISPSVVHQSYGRCCARRPTPLAVAEFAGKWARLHAHRWLSRTGHSVVIPGEAASSARSVPRCRLR